MAAIGDPAYYERVRQELEASKAYLAEEGIYVRNKSVMYPDTDLCHDMLRITPGTRKECERFIGALKRILKAFK